MSLDIRHRLGILAATWNPDLHPRGRDGKFIETFGFVELFGVPGHKDGERGQVKDIKPNPDRPGDPDITVTVDGKDVTTRPGNLSEAPETKAKLDYFSLPEEEIDYQAEVRAVNKEAKARRVADQGTDPYEELRAKVHGTPTPGTDEEAKPTKTGGPDDPFRKGDRVTVTNLTDHPDYNDKSGTVEKNMYGGYSAIVRLDDGTRVSIHQENLRDEAGGETADLDELRKRVHAPSAPNLPIPIEDDTGPEKNAIGKTVTVPNGEEGSKTNPIKTSDPLTAVTALQEGKYVELETIEQVGTLLDQLAFIANEAKANGTKAKNYDLCLVSVPKTNLFCAEAKGIPRIQMPQLGGVPVPGSQADKLPKNGDGEVDIGPAFMEHLRGKGVTVTEIRKPAGFLKASQSELVGTKVAGMMAAMESGNQKAIDGIRESAIFTTTDNYVVDGHHRWAAVVGLDVSDGTPIGDIDMPVRQIDMDILEVLDEANKFAVDFGIAPKGAVDTPLGQVEQPGPETPTPDWPDINFQTANGVDFVTARDSMPEKYKPHLTPHAASDFGEGKKRAFLSEDGMVGFAVAPDGEIVNVFKQPGAPPGAGVTAILSAIENGGWWTNNYDGFLKDYYSQFGFTERERLTWDDQYAPDDWDYKANGRPDVIEMELPAEGRLRGHAEDSYRQFKQGLRASGSTRHGTGHPGPGRDASRHGNTSPGRTWRSVDAGQQDHAGQPVGVPKGRLSLERLLGSAPSPVRGLGVGDWNPDLHPRGRDGRFIEKFGWVDIFGHPNFPDGTRGEVQEIRPNPRTPGRPDIVVKVGNDRVAVTKPLNVSEAPRTKAVLAQEVVSAIDRGETDLAPRLRSRLESFAEQEGLSPEAVRESLLGEYTASLIEQKERNYQRDLTKLNELIPNLTMDNPHVRYGQLDDLFTNLRAPAVDTWEHHDRLPGGGWTQERRAQHEVMWEDLLAAVEQANIPKDRDVLALGGLPGSGKTTALRPGQPAEKLGVIGWNPDEPVPEGATHVVINPDVVKVQLIEAGMAPEGVDRGMKPMEQSTFLHEESSYLAKLFMARLSDMGYNLVLDNTMDSTRGMDKRFKPLAEKGYKFRGLFADIEVPESRKSAYSRYIRSYATPIGGRFVPSSVQRNKESPLGSFSTNRDNFDELVGDDWFIDWMVIDNRGVSEQKPIAKVTAQGKGAGSAATTILAETKRRAAAAQAQRDEILRNLREEGTGPLNGV